MKAMRRNKRLGWAAAAVFGMLFLRALVPAGFMVAAVDGGLAVVLCEPEVLGGGHHHHAGHEHAAHHHGAGADPSCPYAQSSGSAPLPSLPVLAGAALHDFAVLPPSVAQTHLRFGPARQQSSRGPPHLA